VQEGTLYHSTFDGLTALAVISIANTLRFMADQNGDYSGWELDKP
jgi:hypothetical protein